MLITSTKSSYFLNVFYEKAASSFSFNRSCGQTKCLKWPPSFFFFSSYFYFCIFTVYLVGKRFPFSGRLDIASCCSCLKAVDLTVKGDCIFSTTYCVITVVKENITHTHTQFLSATPLSLTQISGL